GEAPALRGQHEAERESDFSARFHAFRTTARSSGPTHRRAPIRLRRVGRAPTLRRMTDSAPTYPAPERPLAGKRALAFVDDIYEDLELWYPKLRMEEAGVRVDVAGPKIQQYAGKHGYPCTPDITIDEARAEDYDMLLVPGGFMPDKLRRVPKVLEICRCFHEQQRPIAFICHAGWILISAKILQGVT